MTARAITYYLDVSNECTRRITQVDGAIKAICHRLVIAEMTDRTSKDLGNIICDNAKFTNIQSEINIVFRNLHGKSFVNLQSKYILESRFR